MRIVKSGKYRYRLNKASMTEIGTKTPYRLQKKELLVGLKCLENYNFTQIYYYIGTITEDRKFYASVCFGDSKGLTIGCMFFSPAETKKLIKWAKEK